MRSTSDIYCESCGSGTGKAAHAHFDEMSDAQKTSTGFFSLLQPARKPYGVTHITLVKPAVSAHVDLPSFEKQAV
ncbi:hypothetical protein [Pararhizobium polonicum]|uniref:hypothetical protein n=1 Tax=Pararhizobium polonicum TaxID=1612624 RepID=UPI00111194AF|nr:hypothetical protein [Pararhizobium polonicum]